MDTVVVTVRRCIGAEETRYDYSVEKDGVSYPMAYYALGTVETDNEVKARVREMFGEKVEISFE